MSKIKKFWITASLLLLGAVIVAVAYFLIIGMLSAMAANRPAADGAPVPASAQPYAQHQWTTEFPPLVAHAGGGLRLASGTLTYTNSIDALVQNYNLGHRIFEFDLLLTSDYKLAAVHDWSRSGISGGTPLSESEWLGFAPDNNAYAPAMLGDILDEMMKKQDMFIITDTKSFSLTDEETLLQFYCLYNETIKRDPALLSRIIPQIYNEAMYGLIARVYEYPSIIYTLYEANATSDEIFAFVQSHDSIKVVTMPSEQGYIDTDLPGRLAAIGKLVYVHTVNNFDEIIPLSLKGAAGFYTDFITPESFAIYQEILAAG